MLSKSDVTLLFVNLEGITAKPRAGGAILERLFAFFTVLPVFLGEVSGKARDLRVCVTICSIQNSQELCSISVKRSPVMIGIQLRKAAKLGLVYELFKSCLAKCYRSNFVHNDNYPAKLTI